MTRTNAIWALWAASVVLIAVSGSALALAAGTRNPPTEMYSGSTHVGRITPTQIGRYRARVWDIDCDAESQFLTRGRSARERTRINLHHWDGVVDGYARFVRGRWLIYRLVYLGEPFALAGSAVHRSPWHWDVFRGGQRMGRTLGPDGPAAATALVLVC